MAGKCGTCTACCRVFAIPTLNKPAGRWCQNCTIGKGCKIYEDRPKVCIDFECLWLQSQSQGKHALPLEMRPDKSRVVISPTTNPKVMSFMFIPGYENAWRKPGLVRNLLITLIKSGIVCIMGPPESQQRTALISMGGRIVEKQVRLSPPDKDGMQWNITSLD